MGIFSILLLLCSVLNFVTPYLDADSWLNIELYHALDRKNPDDFTFRANISTPTINVGVANILKSSLTDEEREQLKDLAEHNQFYRLKSYATFPGGNRVEYLTSTKACALANSQLNDIIWVSVDTTGSVLAISQTVSGFGNCQNAQVKDDDLDLFNTHVIIKQMDLAPVPDTLGFIEKLEREREARERGEVKDNRGFFAKYWMYIVPIGLLVLISGATSPDAAQGGGGR